MRGVGLDSVCATVSSLLLRVPIFVWRNSITQQNNSFFVVSLGNGLAENYCKMKMSNADVVFRRKRHFNEMKMETEKHRVSQINYALLIKRHTDGGWEGGAGRGRWTKEQQSV